MDPEELEDLPEDQKVQAIFRETCVISELAERRVWPVVVDQVSKSDHEQALAATYSRMCLFLRGLAKLDDPCHFQIAAMVARVVFELLLDLKALAKDPALAQKFWDFTSVSRYRKAKQLGDFLLENPSVDKTPHAPALNLVNKPGVKQNREQLCRRRWGTNDKGRLNWPDHWSGKSIAQRAKDAGTEYEEIYRSEFFFQSYYTHSGAAGIDRLSREALTCAFGMAHALVQRLFAEATEIIADQYHLFDADADLQRLLRATAATGSDVYQAKLQAIDHTPNADEIRNKVNG